jgi:molybdopterin synthase catalytic subunit
MTTSPVFHPSAGADVICLTNNSIDFQAVTESVRDHRAGAVVLFLGTVREFTGDAQTTALDYEAYRGMAEQQLKRLHDQVMQSYPVVKASLVHRVGNLAPGDVCVAIAVSTPHRREAFEAGQWLIDTLKEQVPIWKKENYVDGSVEWVHPESSVGSGEIL